MKRVDRIQTFDGVIHDNAREAKKHLDKLFGEIATPLASKIAMTDKYSAACALIEESLDAFRMLIEINDDNQVDDESL